MKTAIITWFAMVIFCSLNGQVNLVSNSSFEYYNQCPNGSRPLGIWNPIPWTDSSACSSDYFHVCGNPNWQIPLNMFGYEYAQDSSAYIGISTFTFPNQWVYDYREYAQGVLIDTLKPGLLYCVTFYVSLSDSSKYAASNMSAYFSTGGAGANASAYFNYVPQINNPDSIDLTNKIGWTKISGTFVANGGEKFITIGNFQNDANTDTTRVNNAAPSSPNFWWLTYYYIDNVSVVEMQPVVTGDSSLICPGDSVQLGVGAISGVNYSWSPSIGLSDTTISNPLASPTVTTTYTLTQTECDAVQTATVTVTIRTDCDTPNVFYIPTVLGTGQSLEISGLKENSHLTIYDMRGRRVFYSENYQNDFRGDSVAEGQYVVELVTSEGERIKQKLIITR